MAKKSAFIETTATGIKRLRRAIRTDGKKKTYTIIHNLGTNEDHAQSIRLKFLEAETQGFRWNPESENIIADILEYLRARTLGIDPNEPAKKISLALDLCLTAKKRSAKTRNKLKAAVTQYLNHSKAVVLDDMTVDSVNAWTHAMDSGELMYTRGGKDAKGNEIFYQYSDRTIATQLSDLRVFCNYCAFRGWMSSDPANKSKPLNPFAQIEIAEPKDSVKRYLVRSEVILLLRAVRPMRNVERGGAIPDDIRKAIIEIALKHPKSGKWTAKKLLEKQGIKVPIWTIDCVWQRNKLDSERRRVLAASRPFIPATENPIGDYRISAIARRWLHFLLYTGLRTGEARRARCEDIIKHEVIDEGATEPRTVYGLNVFKPSKGGDKKIRVVWFGDKALLPHNIPKRFGKTGPLLPQISKSALSHGLRRAVKRSGLVKVRSHDMRHSYARNFLLSGEGHLPALQQRLGHDRLSTTGIYSNFAHTDGAAAAKKYRVK